jgi:hypothetical protein
MGADCAKHYCRGTYDEKCLECDSE